MKYLLIAGSRNYTDRDTFNRVTEEYIDSEDAFTVIVAGGAAGADELAKDYALEHGLQYIEFPADWEKYGRAAGPKRNNEMVKFIKEKNGRALYFWDGESKGTKQCIESARKNGIDVTIWDTAEGRFMEE